MAGKTLLVVEDDSDIREALVEFLSMEGYEVFWAVNGRDALEKLPSIPMPSLILLDLHMPEMTGRELVEALRSDPIFNRVPLSVLTAGNDRDLPGVDGFLVKPLDLDQLLRTIESIAT